MAISQARIAAIGDETRIIGFALVGVTTVAADTDGAVRAAWATLEPDVGLVLLTPGAAAALADELDEPGSNRLTVVLPA